MAGRPIVHFEFQGPDRKALQEFYGKLFGWEIDSLDEMDYGLIRETGANGMGGGIATRTEGPIVVIYMQVPDPMVTIKQAESIGGKMLMPPTDIPNGPTIALISDPQGNTVGLVKGE
jgi:predicted enzyme related to lactoylglutathione lyase